ncbi:hypothetical protein [Dyadobacter sp. NIV53]|uniref:hypothetical protein n=1 Tax=Dyadobacter sp. NIV53 TaxID=2861765 RepID=UPI001C87D85F|nr:hypothetical protein [Dyadobacter sp. NIV53]
MTYIKLIFLIILMMLDRCGIIRHNRMPGQTSDIEKSEPANNSLNGSWRLADAEIRQITVTRQPDSLTNEAVKMEKDEDFLLSFFPDNSFTEVKENGEYTFGKWAQADSSVSIVYPNKTEKYKLLFSRGKRGLREVKLESLTGKSILLAGFGKRMEKYQEDPFYPSNNAWRVKPSAVESDKQIRSRLIRYLSHSAYLLKAADTRKQQIISWEFSKGIIKIYNAGIGMIPKDQMPEVWINSFHSPEDALKAYDMLDDYLRTTSYKGDATGNWVRDDYNILISILEGLKRRV